ncbi:MAG: cytidine deaminase [Sphingomonadaceae bacterium]|nr:cytidine deaminase [Sphingomonadaceae bacterium]
MSHPSAEPGHPRSDRELIQLARAAALRAHAPYSRFHVGCAVESVAGDVVAGANMENACYRLGICAEQAGLAAAAQAFGLAAVARIAVAAGRIGPDGELTGSEPVTSCGGCRQAIAEAAALAGRDVACLFASGDGTRIEIRALSDLLPCAFKADDLA